MDRATPYRLMAHFVLHNMVWLTLLAWPVVADAQAVRVVFAAQSQQQPNCQGPRCPSPQQQVWYGNGVCIAYSKSGQKALIATCGHCVPVRFSRGAVEYDGAKYPVVGVIKDSTCDLAILSVAAPKPPDKSPVAIGTKYPNGFTAQMIGYKGGIGELRAVSLVVDMQEWLSDPGVSVPAYNPHAGPVEQGDSGAPVMHEGKLLGIINTTHTIVSATRINTLLAWAKIGYRMPVTEYGVTPISPPPKEPAAGTDPPAHTEQGDNSPEPAPLPDASGRWKVVGRTAARWALMLALPEVAIPTTIAGAAIGVAGWWFRKRGQKPTAKPPTQPQPNYSSSSLSSEHDRQLSQIAKEVEALKKKDNQPLDQGRPGPNEQEEVSGGGSPSRAIPGRNLDELSQVVRLSQLEGHDPLLDAAFGLFTQDEAESITSDPNTQPIIRTAIEDLLRRVRNRVDAAAPLSVKF